MNTQERWNRANCLVYENSKCLLPSCKKWYGFSTCVLTLRDNRITHCSLRIPLEVAFPPKKPSGPENDKSKIL